MRVVTRMGEHRMRMWKVFGLKDGHESQDCGWQDEKQKLVRENRYKKGGSRQLWLSACLTGNMIISQRF